MSLSRAISLSLFSISFGQLNFAVLDGPAEAAAPSISSR